MKEKKSLRVLYVADLTYWITGNIARRIWKFNEWIEPGLISGASLRDILDLYGGKFPVPVDVVHFLTPQITTEFMGVFRKTAACVATIHHLDEQVSIEPSPDADAVMTVCTQWHDALVASGVASDKCVKIPNAVDPEIFYPVAAEERSRLRARLGLGSSTFCVGFSGKQSSNHTGRKGIDVFVNAAECFSRLYPDSAFLVMGPGWASVANELRERGIRLIYLPFMLDQRSVAEFYRMLDAYWVTSRIEGGPVPLLEAMASGVPNVSTKVGAALEVIESGRNGILVEFDAVGEFVAATLEMAQNPKMREGLANAARSSMIEHFSPAESARPARNLYDIALSNFALRTGQRNHQDPRTRHWRDGILTDIPRSIRKKVDARDELRFMHTLLHAGASVAAKTVALRAMRRAPLNRAILRNALNAFPTATRAITFIRRLVQAVGAR